MTQIVTVSATTAAYATEGLKPSARVSGSTHTAEAVYTQVQEARRADDLQHVQMREMVGPPSVTAFFVTAGERGRQLAQATLREAEEAYFFGREEVEETEGKDEQSRQDAEAEGQDQPQDEQRETESLALPSPEQLLQSVPD